MIYFITSSLLFLAAYIVYVLVLKKLTFFKFNRAYLFRVIVLLNRIAVGVNSIVAGGALLALHLYPTRFAGIGRCHHFDNDGRNRLDFWHLRLRCLPLDDCVIAIDLSSASHPRQNH